jgi:hypothetical protein
MPRVSRPTVTIAIRDEATAALDRAKQELLQIPGEFDANFAREMEAVVGGTQRLGVEFGRSLRLMGIASVVSSGGIVASIGLMGAALANFARNAQNLRYAAEEIGLTSKELQQLTYAARGRGGLNAGRAQSGIQTLGRALNDLKRQGTASETFQKLARIGPGLGVIGLDLIERLRSGSSNRDVMLRLFEVMRDETEAYGDDTQLMRVQLAEALGLGSTAFMGIDKSALDEYGELVEDNTKETAQFLRKLAQLDAEMQNLKTTMGNALMAPFTQLFRAISEAFEGPEGLEFRKWLVQLAAELKKIPWEVIRQKGVAAIPKISAAVRQFSQDAKGVSKDARDINLVVQKWKPVEPEKEETGKDEEQSFISPGTSSPLFYPPEVPEREGQRKFNQYMNMQLRFGEEQAAAAGAAVAGRPPPMEPRSPELPGGFIPGSLAEIDPVTGEWFIRRERIGERAPWTALQGEHTGEVIDLRQGAGGTIGTLERDQSRRDLTQTIKNFADELFEFNDWLRINRGGVTGGNVEGGVTRAGRNRPMQTRGGGRGGAPVSLPGMGTPGSAFSMRARIERGRYLSARREAGYQYFPGPTYGEHENVPGKTVWSGEGTLPNPGDIEQDVDVEERARGRTTEDIQKSEEYYSGQWQRSPYAPGYEKDRFNPYSGERIPGQGLPISLDRTGDGGGGAFRERARIDRAERTRIAGLGAGLQEVGRRRLTEQGLQELGQKRLEETSTFNERFGIDANPVGFSPATDQQARDDEWHKQATLAAKGLGGSASGRADPIVTDKEFWETLKVAGSIATGGILGAAGSAAARYGAHRVEQSFSRTEMIHLPDDEAHGLDVSVNVNIKGPREAVEDVNTSARGDLMQHVDRTAKGDPVTVNREFAMEE